MDTGFEMMKFKLFWLNLKLFFVRIPAWIKFPLRFLLFCTYICFIFKLYSFFMLVFTPVFKEWTDFFLFMVAMSAAIVRLKR